MENTEYVSFFLALNHFYKDLTNSELGQRFDRAFFAVLLLSVAPSRPEGSIVDWKGEVT